MNLESLKFRGHPCFKKQWTGFDQIKPVNVIIGRNNTGKSHLLDFVEAMCEGKEHAHGWEVKGHGRFEEDDLRNFQRNTSGGGLDGNHWDAHGRFFIGEEFTAIYGANGAVNELELKGGDAVLGMNIPYQIERNKMHRLHNLKASAGQPKSALSGQVFRRLLADRDITAEEGHKDIGLYSNGKGATNIIRRFLLTSHKAYPRELIQDNLRKALNEIFGSDGQFTEISVRIHDDPTDTEIRLNDWEVYLAEKGKGLIALSDSGSGLKTVILVLLFLLVVPRIEGKPYSQYVYAFEELENNLHPALLRRLFAYIERFALEQKAIIFLTTHSSVALDYFGVSKDAQLIHVKHDGESGSAQTIAAYFDHKSVISELGAKPSDLLQSNGIIWVEGPSDRIYVNRWIELVSGGELKEGRHYLCASYGGALLARSQFVSPDAADKEMTNLLHINPNIVVVCDSDKTVQADELKKRVQRIEEEVKRTPNAVMWVTAAKEVENYLPGEVLSKVFKKEEMPNPTQFERFFPATDGSKNYTETHLERKTVDKVELASESSPHMTLENMSGRFDWLDQLKAIVAKIRAWNN